MVNPVTMFAFPLAVLFSCLVGALRIGGMTHPSYQAVAHVWVGMLLGIAIAKWDSRYGWLFAALCFVEVTMAVFTRVL